MTPLRVMTRLRLMTSLRLDDRCDSSFVIAAA
jgi:hypothetical protein